MFVTFVCCFGFEDSTECLYTFYNVQVIKMTTLSWASHSTMESMPFSKIYFARSLKIFTIRYDENMDVLTYSVNLLVVEQTAGLADWDACLTTTAMKSTL